MQIEINQLHPAEVKLDNIPPKHILTINENANVNTPLISGIPCNNIRSKKMPTPQP